MKKLKIGVLALIACLFLTGCGCTNNKLTEFTVTFDSDGGTTVSSQVVTKGEKATEPADPTKEGYAFGGWYLDNEEYDFSTPVTKDITLKAKWGVASSGEQEEVPACKLTCEDGYELINGDSEDCECKKKVVGVSSISLSKTSVTLLVGESATITATVNPSNADNKTVTWKSSNTKVVTVANGKLTAIGVGTAKITVTAGGKTNTVNVTVTTKDKQALNNALNAMSAKNITNGNTSINYTYNGCTITNTANTPSNAKTVVENGVVKTVYRDVTAGSISSTYSVTCGSETGSKTVKHTVAASSYTYTSSLQKMMALYVISVSNATDYTINVNGTPAKYLASVEGAQVGEAIHVKGTTYTMTLNSDLNTIYAVKSAE